MKKNLLILIVFIIGITCYSQNGVQEKMLIAKYGLPVIFFSSSYNPKEYIIDYHDSLSRSNWKIILPPENMITEIAQLFIQKKLYEKAYWLLRMNIENYPKNYKLYQQMGDYYKIIGDNDRSFVYYSKALTIKYKFSSFISDSLLKIDDAITTDYKKLSEQVSRKALPPEYLVASIAFRLLEKKENEKAYSLFKMNTENYPNSYNAIDDLGDYYDAIGDSTKAFVYWANALIHQYHLPSIFFDASFDPASYFQVYYKELAEKSGKKILPSDTMLNAIGLTFLAGKMSDKAGQLLKINVENYPERPWHYFALSQYYASIDDKDKAT